MSVAITPATATVDAANTATLTATVTNDKNSDGVTWTASAGTISGSSASATFTAPAATTSAQTVTVTATSKADTSKTGSATMTVPAKLAITSTGGATGSLAGIVGSVYSVQLATTGGISPYSWSLATGSTLPACLSMTSAGLITSTGALTASCVVDPILTFDVTDSGSPALTSSEQLDLVINPAPAITFTGTVQATATYNTAYPSGSSAAATGGAGALSYGLAKGSGPLPNGLTLSATTGAITGTPTAAGTFKFTVQAADSYGDVATQGYTITVSGEPPTLAFNSIPAETYGGAPFTVTAIDASSTPSNGAITYSLTPGQTSAGTVTSAGVVTITGAGSIYLTASQAASGNYAATTATTSVVIAPEPPGLSFAVIPAQTFGGPTFQVTASDASGTLSNGAITYSLTSGKTSAGTVTSAGVVTITGAGTIYLTASQAASGNYAATTATTTVTVNAETPTLTFGTIPAKTYGNAPFQVTASSASSGAVTYSLTSGQTSAGTVTSAGMVTITGAGTIYLTANQAASGNYAADSATTSFTVAPETPTLAFGTIPTETYGNGTFTVTASSASSGAVTYSLTSGQTSAGTVTTGGVVTINSVGTIYLTASQAASGNYTAATATTTVPINGEAPGLSFAAIPAKTFGGPTFQVTASDAPATLSSGAITYSLTSGKTSAGTVTSAGVVTITGAGTIYLTASQAASGNYAAATATTTVTVNAETPTLTFATIPAQTYGNGTFTVTASSASSGAVTYSLTAGQSSVGTVTTGGVVTITGAGTIYLTASQAASGNYAAATATTTVTVSAETPTLTFGAIPTETYGNGTFTVTASSASSGAVTYSLTAGQTSAGTVTTGGVVTINSVGTIYLTASQAASSNYTAATATTSVPINAEAPGLSFAAVSAKTFGGPTFQVTASDASTTISSGAITYSLTQGQTSAGTVTSGGVVTITGAGTIYLTASQVASGNYAAATATTTVTVNPETPTLTFTSAPTNKTYGNAAFTVVAADSTGPVSSGAITYSVTSGPASIGSTTGVVTLSGSGTVYLQASQAASGNFAATTATASFTVYPTLTLPATTLPTGVIGKLYTQNLNLLVTGGNGVYSWTLASGSANLAADNLALSTGTAALGGGVVSGTPASSNSGENFSATVSDTAGNSVTTAFTVKINASLTVSTTTLPYGYTGSGATYSQTLAATGGTGTYSSWAVTQGNTQFAALGLSLNTSTGVISNTSTLVAGSTTFTVQVTDSGGSTASQPLTISVYAPLALPASSTSVPGPATFGQGYAGSITATGGSGNFTWTVTGLPSAGFSFTPTTGSSLSISAMTAPSTAQTINFTAKVTDNVTGKYTSAIPYSIVVGPPAPLTLQPASGTALPGAITGENYSNSSITVTNGSNSGYAFTVSGTGVTAVNSTSWTLPDNLTASSIGGVLTISGKPNATTAISLAVTATDGAGDSVGPYNYTIALTNPTPLGLPAAGALTAAVIGQSYSGSLNVTGGDQTNYTWTVNSTTLTSGTPFAIGTSGISVESFGGYTLSITGPCTTYGTATLNVSVLDVGTGQTLGPIQYTIACNPASPLSLSPTSSTLASGYINNSYGASITAANGSNSGYAFSVTAGTTTTVVTVGNSVSIGDGLTVSVPSTGSNTLNIGGTPTQSEDLPLSVTVNDSAGDPAASAAYVIAIINPEAGYTVSGHISYSGKQTGWTYIQLGSTGLGTAISEATLAAGGAYTIHGVPPGTYDVYAFMDPLGYGAQNAIDPDGDSGGNVNVTTGNVTGADDTMIDPTGLTLNSAPTWDSSQGFGAFSGGAFVSFDIIKSVDVEQAAAYTVQWSTSSSFSSVTGSQCFPATGSSNPWVVTGITGSGPYYFRAAGMLGNCATTATGPWSDASPAITIAAPTGGNAVSGKVTFSGTATGPLYVGFYDTSTGQIYADVVGSKTTPPTSPASYSVHVPTGSNYYFFGVVDQNNLGLINAPGEISNINQQGLGVVAITGATTAENLDLTADSANSVAFVRTVNKQQTYNGVTSTSYQLDFRLYGLLKLPVSVELATESTTGIVVPADIATGAFNGNHDEFDYWPNLNGDIPAQGDIYKLNVTYSDGTSNSTANTPANPLILTVGAPLNAYATLNSPTGTGASTMPSFSWSYPSGASSSDLYQFELDDSNGNTLWKIPPSHSSSNGFANTITPLITWNIDPTGSGDLPSVPILSSDSSYWWSIQTTDANGDEATAQVAFQTWGTPLSLPTTNPSTLPSTYVVNQQYYGSVTAIGGVAPYHWQVNFVSGSLNWSPNSSDNATLIISGYSASTGTITFNATVWDSTGASFGPETYTITFNSAVANTYTVSGTVSFNGCGSGNEPPITLTIGGTGFAGPRTTTSDGDGNYEFLNIPNGTYTIKPSISTAAGMSATFGNGGPLLLDVKVNNYNVNAPSFVAYLGYTVSGQVGYNGTKSGQVYLSMDGCTSPTPGTSISGPGAFTIRGVPPGVYTLNAWMDNLNTGVQNASNPLGKTSNVIVPNANDSYITVGLTDPSAVTLSSAPALGKVNGFVNGAILTFGPAYASNSAGNSVESATSYTVEWSTTQDFSTVAGSESFPATGASPGFWILNTASVSGLTQGDSYYFRAQGVAGTSTSSWSKVKGPVTISAPATTNTVSGKITFSQTATGPLYVGFLDQDTGNNYITQVGSKATKPTSPASYSVQVPTGSNYFLYAILDQNNNGLADPADITNANAYNMITPAVAITSGANTKNLTLASGNSSAVVRTEYDNVINALGTNNGTYSLWFDVTPVSKLPVAVALTSAPTGSIMVVPADIAWCAGCGIDPPSAFNFQYNYLSTAPTVGEAYGLEIKYLGSATVDTPSPQITNVITDVPTGLSPSGSITTTNAKPTFTWTYPTTNAASYLYQLYLADESWNTVWSIPYVYSGSNPFTSSVTPSIAFGTDPTNSANTPTVSSLTNTELYNWILVAFDADGNLGQTQTIYVSDYQSISLPAPNPSSLGSATIGQSYSGSITASGGYYPYAYSVTTSTDNCSTCYYWTGVSLGNGLTVTKAYGTLKITGTPTSTGSDTFTVYAEDSIGAKATPVQYTININNYANVSLPSSSPLGEAFVSTAYTGTISASGGPGGSNYSWTVNGQTIPNNGSPVTLLNLNGLTATNSGNKRLTIAGTPTQTETASLQVVVTDNENNSDTATATYKLPVVTGPTTVNNKYLSGTYTCKLDGYEDSDGSRLTILSSFQASGATGLLSNGVWDQNGRDFTAGEMTGTATGSYSIGADNNGLMTVNTSYTYDGKAGTGTSQYAIALNNTGSKTTATEFRMAQMDTDGQHSTGVCYQATTTSVFGTDIFKGNSFVFQINGESGSGNPEAALGRFYNASGTAAGNLTGGVVDDASISDSSVTEMTLTGGTYTVPDATNGRSTFTVTTSDGPGNFEVYVIDANRMFILMTGVEKAQSGDVRKQIVTSYTGIGTGSFVTYERGYDYSNASSPQYDSMIVQASSNNSNVATVNQMYQDENGAYQPNGSKAIGSTSTVTFDQTAGNNGRATIVVSGSSDTMIAYYYNTGSAFQLDFNGSGSYLATGWTEPQTQTTFTDAKLGGDYLLGTMGEMKASKSTTMGEADLSTTSGAITGSLTQAGEGEFSWDQTLSGLTYAWDTSTTNTGTFILSQDSSAIASCAVISSTKAVCTNQTDFPEIMILEQ